MTIARFIKSTKNKFRHMKTICAPLFLFAAFLAGGCGDKSAPYTLELDGKSTEGVVALGGKVAIAMKSNPSTGYLWRISENGAPCLKFLKEEYDGTNPELLGSGGITKFTFEACRSGSSKVELEYGRSWEIGGAVKKAAFKIKVR